MKDPYSVVRTVRVTEKGTALSEKLNQYQLVVEKHANKLDIKHAVEKLFGVNVVRVNTQQVRGKARRERTLAFGRTPSWKKAIVTLAEGNRIELFESIESRFATQARWTTAATGASGFWIVWRYELWGRFAEPAYWWMHAMVAVWALFTLMLFVLEPLWLHRWFLARARRDPEGTFRLVQGLHWILLTASLVTIAGAVAGSHGWLPFG